MSIKHSSATDSSAGQHRSSRRMSLVAVKGTSTPWSCRNPFETMCPFSAYGLGRRGLALAHFTPGVVVRRPGRRVRGHVRLTNDRPIAPVVRPRRRRELDVRVGAQRPQVRRERPRALVVRVHTRNKDTSFQKDSAQNRASQCPRWSREMSVRTVGAGLQTVVDECSLDIRSVDGGDVVAEVREAGREGWSRRSRCRRH